MRRPSGFPTWILACLVAALPAALTAARAADEPPAPAQDTGATGEPAGEGAAAQPGSGATRRGWWNEPSISSTLSVTDAQRKKMDAHLDAYLEAVRGGDGPELMAAFQQALRAADWNKARVELARLVEQGGVPARAQGELKIRVLSELDAAQHKLLLEKYPRLIERPWMRPQPRGGGQGGQGRRPGGSGAVPR